jgi:CubicO group peptidase (beta-lactamase class C family)
MRTISTPTSLHFAVAISPKGFSMSSPRQARVLVGGQFVMLLQSSALVMFVAFQVTSAAEFVTWPTATAESQGLSSSKLAQLQETLASRNTKALLIIRNDQIVHEWYAEGHGPEKAHYTASLAKAIVGGVSLGIAISDNRIELTDPVSKYVPQWKMDPRKASITIAQLGSHTSGLEDAEADGLAHDKLTGWKGDFWKRRPPPRDPFTISRDITPLVYEPGQESRYSNPGIAMLSYVITAAIQDGPQQDLRTLLAERVMRPMGVPAREWSVGYGQTVEVDGLPLVASWGGGNYTARAVARVGRLMLKQGNWNGEQLLSGQAVREITSDAPWPGNGGMGWWSNRGGKHPQLPRDAYWGAGAGHQILLVAPSLQLIVVRNGGALAGGGDATYHTALNTHLFEPLMNCLLPDASSAKPPYPASKHIASIDWAPPETIVRQAKGGDNWPATWADDGHLYSAYGDGNGFEPFVRPKLSLGFVRIEGLPDQCRGINIRSSSGEQLGDGPRGKKASGMLMVDGVLYMLVRNADNSQLAWSTDHAQTWQWSDWKFETSFGCPTFLNFGQNYTGARDEFVYIYSHDHDSAYEPADRMVMARVRRERLRHRDAYEFFAGLDRQGEPQWTRDIEQRRAVFSHPQRCYRSGITYNPGLKRYLWCQILPGKEPRFEGGCGVYEAPQPWGPWSTVYFTEKWDVGPGETSSFPTKWMSADGLTLHLLFSGDDYFSVRRARLNLAGKSP